MAWKASTLNPADSQGLKSSCRLWRGLVTVGGAVKGDYTGNCSWFFRARGELLGIVAFSGAPEPWLSMVNEYHSLREQAIVIIEPVHVVCQAGGGVVPGGIGRQIVDFFDRAQNRMYEMLQQARAMTP